jgi:hypothetical protein
LGIKDPQQSTNLAVGGSNPFGRANYFKGLFAIQRHSKIVKMDRGNDSRQDSAHSCPGNSPGNLAISTVEATSMAIASE